MLNVRKWLVRLAAPLLVGLLAVCLSWIFSPCHDPGYQQANAPNADSECAGFFGVTIAGVSSAVRWVEALKPEDWTAIATAVIGLFTFTLWYTNWRQLKHARRIERAYIWGGGGLDRATRKTFELSVNNFGKTPGRLTEFAVGFCSLRNIPAVPQYSSREKFHDWIPPVPERIRVIRKIDSPLPLNSDLLIYGRFWFRDIWEEGHSIGFVLVIRDDGLSNGPDTSGIVPAGIPDAYTKWD